MFVRRRTLWYDAGGNVVQVESAHIDPATCDVLATAVEPVAPFDTPEVAMALCDAVSTSLARGQYPGQLELL